ncbi:hypothetical protein GCM10025867_28040 [Frondihabitans sucicola]|uniref:GNAT family N-acetyltransferase n=1 Tax=Frondihabitans sucicola TaxID=1268041 RepID=A0ABM8GQ24_9MICO|nr:hypothetical protein [Frondihabitans sucicola]BDZ50563.1 hypothetical protein GCM10025867_28040 [Frondihabitans sucicola]
MLDETGPLTWLVRASDDSPPEALVEAFARGFKLTSWSLIESERRNLGVYTSAHHAETAWWRHRDTTPDA